IMAYIVESSQEGAYVSCTGFCRKDCLSRREAERDVDLYALRCKSLCGFKSVARQRTFDYDVGRNTSIFAPFFKHFVHLKACDLHRDIAVYYLANGGNVLLEINVAFFGYERRVRRDAINQAKLCGLTNLVQICRINKEFHLTPPSKRNGKNVKAPA